MLQLSKFVWTLRSSAWVIFNDFILIDATDKVRLVAIKELIFRRKGYTHFYF